MIDQVFRITQNHVCSSTFVRKMIAMKIPTDSFAITSFAYCSQNRLYQDQNMFDDLKGRLFNLSTFAGGLSKESVVFHYFMDDDIVVAKISTKSKDETKICKELNGNLQIPKLLEVIENDHYIMMVMERKMDNH